MFSTMKEENLFLVTLHLLLFICCVFVGSVLMSAMILYEKCHIEDKKRTVMHHLGSSLCIAVMLFNLTVLPSLLYHRILHDLSIRVHVWLSFGTIFIIVFTLLTFSQIIWARCFYITHYALVAELNEFHVSWTLEFCNVLLSIIWASAKVHENSQTKIFSSWLSSLCLLFVASIVIGIIVVMGKTLALHFRVEATIPTPSPSINPLSKIEDKNEEQDYLAPYDRDLQSLASSHSGPSQIILVQPAKDQLSISSSEAPSKSRSRLSLIDSDSMSRSSRRTSGSLRSLRHMKMTSDSNDDSKSRKMTSEDSLGESIFLPVQRLDSDESKFETRSTMSRIPILTVTPSPSVIHDLTPSPSVIQDLNPSPVDSSPRSPKSHLSIAQSSIHTASSIPSVSSVSLNLESIVPEPLLQDSPLKNSIIYLITVLLVTLVYYIPLLILQDPNNLYFFSIHCLLCVLLPVLYFMLRPQKLRTVVQTLCSSCSWI